MIVHHSYELSTIYIHQEMTSSYIPEAFTDGHEVWRLAAPTLSPSVKNNFFVQIVLQNSLTFADSSNLHISYGLETDPGNDYLTHVYYYDDQNNIAGFFLYGHFSKERDIRLTLYYQDPISDDTEISMREDMKLHVLPILTDNNTDLAVPALQEGVLQPA